MKSAPLTNVYSFGVLRTATCHLKGGLKVYIPFYISGLRLIST